MRIFLAFILLGATACTAPGDAAYVRIEQALMKTGRFLENKPDAALLQQGWSPARLPENFSRLLNLNNYSGFITLRFLVPPPVVKAAEEGSELVLDAGVLSDVSRFYFNGRDFGGRGSVNPYKPGSMRPFIASLPRQALRPNEPNYITVHLYADAGQYFLQIMRPFRLGPASAVWRDYYYREFMNSR